VSQHRVPDLSPEAGKVGGVALHTPPPPAGGKGAIKGGEGGGIAPARVRVEGSQVGHCTDGRLLFGNHRHVLRVRSGCADGPRHMPLHTASGTSGFAAAIHCTVSHARCRRVAVDNSLHTHKSGIGNILITPRLITCCRCVCCR
jgi:hypothetical protein